MIRRFVTYTRAFKPLCRQVHLHTRALPRTTRLVKRASRFPAVRSSALPSQGPSSKIRLFCFWTRPRGRRGNILSVPRKHFLDHSRRRVFIALLHACCHSALDSESEEFVTRALKALSVCLVVVQPCDRHSERPMLSSTPQQHAALSQSPHITAHPHHACDCPSAVHYPRRRQDCGRAQGVDKDIIMLNCLRVLWMCAAV